ncbi:hypothetical protein CBR_g36839 [Chara braunii]|uniref:DSBA-like thioredoxin domain-containing protein n=1 Tax=Chara braunii TaxID=69332 RepID=A0A388LLX2_CHABU|nr:hypothetical protein CBR_g36839 [Chara braunii]|eukprot:GBG83225.1 hypothetical protein CBR_g36839 [Chara braunii]
MGDAMAGRGGALVVHVDVWSDIACPWCYVGKARLDSAISSLEGEGKAKVDVRWHAYMIDSRTKSNGEEYLAYNRRRWGSDGWTHSLRSSARRDGLAFGDWKWWPNTLHAHRLVHLAEKVGRGSEAKDRLFQKTYEEGGNVSLVDVVCSIADDMGLEGGRQALERGEAMAEVIAEDRRAKEKLNIHSVPHFIVGNKLALSGAQDPAAFESAILKVVRSEAR